MTTSAKFLAIASAALLAVAAAALVLHRHHAPKLPKREQYGSLPPAFGNALTSARAKVVDGGFSEADVRELARLYQANRLNDEANACYAILRSSPGGLSAQDHYYLSDIALFEGDLDSAVPELRQAIAMEPQYLPARLQLGDALFKSGKPADAAREYESILLLAPIQPQAMFGLSRIDIQQGDDTKAIGRLEALLTAHPEMTSAAALLAQVFDRRGEKEKATLMGQWARQKPEPVPEDPWMDALLRYSYDIQRLSLKFEEYLASGGIDHALPLLSRVEELDPKSPIPQLLRGWSQARDHNDAEAVRQYRMALDKGGDPERICPYMVQSLVSLGRIDDAEKLLAEFYAKKPDSVPILIAYSDVAVRKGDNTRAKELLRKVLTKEPYRFAANMNLAKILWASGEKDEAAACLERAAKVSSGDIPSRALLGEYYLGK
ncbi:MAG TPA: tetratricopeptide repeat protein, partial [Opitutaceae bacterium]|nr:tetratricopeptide repeat protein [Opitutaceae bacterium]